LDPRLRGDDVRRNAPDAGMDRLVLGSGSLSIPGLT